MEYSWIFAAFLLFLVRLLHGGVNASMDPMVGLTLIHSAVATGAVCLDGSPPGYHLQRGHGPGAHNWLIDLEGGAWCNNKTACIYRSTLDLGSSEYMENQISFSAILSNDAQENPDFHNWNRVRVRYCDGASFAGEGYDKDSNLYFRGERIWYAVMEELMSKGMRSANQALLSGCSAGGLASILHCDKFRSLFPQKTKVKCLADAGLFLDAVDIAGQHTLRSFYDGVVTLQGVAQTLPKSCTSRMNATLCFFPQNLINEIKTPMFLLNAAYDSWQIGHSLATNSADKNGVWEYCKLDINNCDSAQIKFLQGFRGQMKRIAENFYESKKENGLFINSCFTHCQSTNQDSWFGDESPAIANKGIAKSVGDWYYERAQVKAIDCAYPCDKTCL